jgi:hypothetical protein
MRQNDADHQPSNERSGMPVVIALAVFLLIVVAITVPAGYGLPAPAFALIALGACVPGLLVGWLLYRALVRRGQVPPLGEGLHEGPAPHREVGTGERPAHRTPNREQRATRGRFFPG